jgi:peptidoglycan/xylan/chitin deacetylase (PgdA/CDA1 family)
VVLYFHHVHPRLRHYTSLAPQAFDRALAQVQERLEPLPPEAVSTVLSRERGHPRPSCLLTFDDGYADVFEHALPVMERRGWRAVFFVSVALVGQVERHPIRGPLRHMTWKQLRELRRRGHVVTNHGFRHVNLKHLAADETQREIDQARAILERHMPGTPDWFAYPFGHVPASRDLRLPELCFGSVKAPARPWHVARHEIRRTYLPADEPQRWARCLTEWRRAWDPTA